MLLQFCQPWECNSLYILVFLFIEFLGLLFCVAAKGCAGKDNTIGSKIEASMGIWFGEGSKEFPKLESSKDPMPCSPPNRRRSRHHRDLHYHWAGEQLTPGLQSPNILILISSANRTYLHHLFLPSSHHHWHWLAPCACWLLRFEVSLAKMCSRIVLAPVGLSLLVASLASSEGQDRLRMI